MLKSISTARTQQGTFTPVEKQMFGAALLIEPEISSTLDQASELGQTGYSSSLLQQLTCVTKRFRHLNAEQYLLRQQDSFESLFVVKKGALKSYRLTPEGEEIVTGFYLEGDVIGAGGLGNQKHFYSVVALEPASLYEIPFAKLLQLSTMEPIVQQLMLKLLSQEMQADQSLRLIQLKQVKAAIASLILNMANRLTTTQLTLPMSRVDIANLLGVASETVCREFTRLQKQGLLSVNRKHIVINDLPQLQQAAGADCC
ncbi:helix-turn-helix domain-containing protein [Shewanella sp. JBTF-M18]|uniref:Helix-turn-helix domain-containing protein n=1 Tax=Shewanella insulae TaxID=2681496 RepID=A0A6L7HX90_9GAMM|nr:cyclic nucleotide-binding domain-containing protein [Shewanella insulae]MXR67671.1 helix-turn-helix domain-containing protein [Shewanella insulae]